MTADLETLEEAISDLLETIGVDLVDVDLRQGSLCVTVTHVDGLDLDVLTKASRAVSDFLDTHEELAPAEPYELEVSSPGLERRLRKQSQFNAVIGQQISVRTVGSAPGARRDEGELLGADDHGIVIRSNASATDRAISYADIDRAHTIFDWKAALAEDKRDRAGDEPSSKIKPASTKVQHNTQARAPHMESKR